MKNLWYYDFSMGKYDLINQISSQTQLFKTASGLLKQDLQILSLICKNLPSVGTSFGNRPRWEMEPGGHLWNSSVHQNEMKEGRERPPEVYWWEGRIHLQVSACLSPPREGCTQNGLYLNQGGTVNRERVLTHQPLWRCAELDSSARKPELASGNTGVFSKFVCQSKHFKSKNIFLHLVWDFLKKSQRFSGSVFSSVGLDYT